MPVVFVSEDGKNKLPPRRAADFYPTDFWYARGLVEYMRDFMFETALKIGMKPPRPLAVLDPGCGNDPVFARAMAEAFPGSYTVGVELRPEARETAMENVHLYIGEKSFLDYNPFEDPTRGEFEVIAGNPPFSHAEEFVRHSFELLRFGGWIGFLLPITFLASNGRATGLYKEFPPIRVVFLGNRPSFSGDGQTAPNEYVFILWRKGFAGVPSVDWLSIPEPAEARAERLERRRIRREQERAERERRKAEAEALSIMDLETPIETEGSEPVMPVFTGGRVEYWPVSRVEAASKWVCAICGTEQICMDDGEAYVCEDRGACAHRTDPSRCPICGEPGQEISDFDDTIRQYTCRNMECPGAFFEGAAIGGN